MQTLHNSDLGKLILRLSIGILMLLHGISKLSKGTAGIEKLFAENGIPGFLANTVYLGEVAAPLLIIAGWYSRLGALLLAFTMVVATGLAHSEDVFTLTRGGGWGVEVQALYFFGALAIASMGSGKYGLSGGKGNWD